MLDEYLEYLEYTKKEYLDDYIKNDGDDSRIKYYPLIRNNKTGLSRPLIIISKYFLNKYKDKELTIDALKAWFGLEVECKNEEINAFKGYFNDLLEYYVKKNNERQRYVDEFNKNIKINSFFVNPYNTEATYNEAHNKNDINKINCIDIIDSLINKPIKQRVLVAKEDIFAEDKLKILFIDNIKKHELTPQKKDYLLKVICSFLIKRKPNQEEVVIKAVDYQNWSILRSKKHYPINYYKYKGGNFPIRKKNNSAITIDKNVIDVFRIVDFDKVKENIQIGEIVYIDKGCNKELEKRKINSEKDLTELTSLLECRCYRN